MFDHLTDFINSFTGLVAAVTALLGGMAALLQAWRRWKDLLAKEPSDNEAIAVNKRKRVAVLLTLIGIVLVLISASIFSVRATAETTSSLSITQQPLTKQNKWGNK